ncbi:MAG: ABC transporter substrate-binding protein [Acidimicrobiales bacterium]
MTTSRTRRALARLAALVGAGSLLAGVAPAAAQQPAETTKAGEPAQANRVTVAIKAYENNLTPFTLTMMSLPDVHDTVNLVYDTLFWSQVKEKPEPWLAESAESSPDQKVWTVKLRSGVMWHDGRPLTAEDVKFTFEYMKKIPTGRYTHHVWESPVFSSAEVLDPLTVRLTFEEPAPTFMILPGADLPIVPKHVWEPIPPKEASKSTDMLPIGSGPYKVTEIVPDQRYKLEANQLYFKGKPKVDVIDLPIVKDPSAAFAALQTGQVDSVTRTVPPELYDQLSNTAGISVMKGTRMESAQIHFNTLKAPLTDAKLRKAISMATDNNAIVQTVLLGHGRPGRDGWIHPDSAWTDASTAFGHAGGTGHQYDPALANRNLDAAGYTRDSDGVRRTPDGKRIELNVLVSANEPQQLRAAQVMSTQLEAIGVKLGVEAIDPAALRQRRNTGNYDTFISNLESHAHADPDALFFFFHTPPATSTTPASFGGYSNPAFDALGAKAKSTVDLEARQAMLNQMQAMFAEDSPALVLYYSDGLYAYRTGAYNGWISDTGHGIFTKRSFLPGYQSAEAAASGSGTKSAAPWAAVAVAIVFAGTGAGVMVGRRRRQEQALEEA